MSSRTFSDFFSHTYMCIEMSLYGRSFATKDHLANHANNVHSQPCHEKAKKVSRPDMFNCNVCTEGYSTEQRLNKHMARHKRENVVFKRSISNTTTTLL